MCASYEGFRRIHEKLKKLIRHTNRISNPNGALFFNFTFDEDLGFSETRA